MGQLWRSFLLLIGLSFANCLHAESPIEEAPPHYLFKILSTKDWKESQGQPCLKLSSYDIKFIHLCTETQIDRIVEKFYGNEEQVIVIKVETPKLSGKLIKEKNPGGFTEYYHLYEGSIPMSSVVDHNVQKVQKRR